MDAFTEAATVFSVLSQLVKRSLLALRIMSRFASSCHLDGASRNGRSYTLERQICRRFAPKSRSASMLRTNYGRSLSPAPKTFQLPLPRSTWNEVGDFRYWQAVAFAALQHLSGYLGIGVHCPKLAWNDMSRMPLRGHAATCSKISISHYNILSIYVRSIIRALSKHDGGSDEHEDDLGSNGKL